MQDDEFPKGFAPRHAQISEDTEHSISRRSGSLRQREVAKRIFAKEYRESNLTFKESDDQYAPLYLLTPTGAKCNRVFVVGTLTEKEDIGAGVEFWRARVADPTGVFTVYAGQYQPEASQALGEIEPPQFVAVAGKVNVYDPGDGKITSIRPESISVVDAETRDVWIMETARHTLERLSSLTRSEDPDVKKAVEHYSPDRRHYKQMVLMALMSMTDEPTEEENSDKGGFDVIDMSQI
ncbi:MAG: DNA-binding protein [Methanosarcinales archaeon Met12]|nr:MAG: DNA-binding protein [Methanosarcinales archaeon Met12]